MLDLYHDTWPVTSASETMGDMEERTAMKVHRAMTRWSALGELVTELMLVAHGAIAIGLGIAVGWRFELAFAWWIVVAATTFVAVTVGLYFRPTVWISVVLGSIATTALSAVVFGALLSGLVGKLVSGDAGLIVSMVLGGVIGLGLAVGSYGPFIRRLRSAPSKVGDG